MRGGRPAIVTSPALADAREAYAWIRKDSRQAAIHFRAAVSRAARAIGEYPDIGRTRPEVAFPSTRFFVLTGFPYVLVYRSDTTPPRILRILHGARDLGGVLGEGGPG